MLKLNKPLVSSILLFAIVLSGCNSSGNKPSVEEPVTATRPAYQHMGAATYAPVDINYVVENPLEITIVDETADSSFQRSYFTISGLKDKIVEEKINADIKALYQHLTPYVTGEELVPYRGIRAVITPERKLEHSYLAVAPYYNSNYVLSVVGVAAGSYYDPDNWHNSYFSYMDCLNIDLNTGDSFGILDVFVNDVDGLVIANDSIANEINRRMRIRSVEHEDYYGTFDLVAPFKGINSDQKFFLGYEGINIVIDHNNPEFSLGFNNTSVAIPYYSDAGHIAITKRFYNQQSDIFEKAPSSKKFLNDFQQNMVRESDSYVKEGIQWQITSGHPANMPQFLVKIMEQHIEQQAKELILLSKESPISFAELSTYVYRIGKYYNISSHRHFGHPSNSHSHWEEFNYVYTESGQQLALTDIFVEDYDYIGLLKGSLDRTVKDYGLFLAYDVDKLLDGMMLKINDNSISFITKPYQWEENSRYPIYLNSSFEEIGIDNLKIFQ